MITLEQFRKNADKNSLCEEYVERWNKCNSNKQYVDMALSAKGIDFLFDSIAKGWGITVDQIFKRFHPYLNGRYVCDCGKYDSCLYVSYAGDIPISTTILGLIDCNVTLYAESSVITEVYCFGKCDISVQGNGNFAFVCYGNEEDIVIYGDKDKFKRINKKDRD